MTGASVAKRAEWPLVLILVAAAVLRLPALDRVPPGFQFDKGYRDMGALRKLRSDRIVVSLANARDSLIIIAQNALSGETGVLPTHGGKIAPVGYTKSDEIQAGGAEPVELFWRLSADTDDDQSGLPDTRLILDRSVDVTA
jgi:hypothetical protein